MQKLNPEMIALGPKPCTPELLHLNCIICTSDTGQMLLGHKLSHGYTPDVETVHQLSVLATEKPQEVIGTGVTTPEPWPRLFVLCIVCVLCCLQIPDWVTLTGH